MKAPEDIQHDIERTRGELADTLHAIERKLSPRQVMDRAMDTMRDVSNTRIIDVVRGNPVPLALMGLGVGWFLINAVRERDGRFIEGSAAPRYAAPGYVGAIGRVEGAAGEALEETGESLGETLSDAVEGAADKAKQYTRQAARRAAAQTREVAGQVRETLSETQEQAQRWVSQAARTMQRQAGSVAERSGDVYRQHPLMVGMVAAVAGLALGSALSLTRREEDVMGEAGGELTRSARAAAGRVVATAKEQGADLLEKVKDETQRQFGLGEGPSGLAH